MFIKKKIIPVNMNLSELLDSCESKLLAYDHYIKFETDWLFVNSTWKYFDISLKSSVVTSKRHQEISNFQK